MKLQEWQKIMYERLESEGMVYKFCVYADVAYSTLYRMRNPNGIPLKERTIKHIKGKWKGFEAKLNKKKAKLEAEEQL